KTEDIPKDQLSYSETSRAIPFMVQSSEERNDEWWARYDAYITSEKWRELRAAVMERCGGLCEGCRDSRATQVHHLTYGHFRHEFLWELAAVCRACHERVHGRELPRK